jgi:hypothetical protein
MSQPLGFAPGSTEEAAYLARLFSNHDFAIALDLVKLDHTPIRSLLDQTTNQPLTLDGQINLQRDSAVRRTATFTFDDPEHSLHLDADSPWEGAIFADRMIRVRHTVTVPGIGKVTAVPFIGPITKVSRDGDAVSVECQDKACLALTGGPPVKVTKGSDAVAAIRKLMAQGAGETKFRLPSGLKRNLHKAYATGWHDDASPWLVCSRIANQLNRQLLYSCDGYLTLRPLPTLSSVTATGLVITSPPTVDWDSSEVRNIVRVTGTLAPKKKKTTRADAKPQLERPPTKLSAVAVAAASHPLSPNKLGRNGVPRYLPVLIEGAVYKSLSQARQLASTTLTRSLPLTTGVAFDMIPVFHLDVGDVITAQTSSGRVVVRLEEGSIPLTVSGDMSVGYQRRVSRSKAHSRIRVHRQDFAPTKKQRREYHKALVAWRKDHRHHHG